MQGRGATALATAVLAAVAAPWAVEAQSNCVALGGTYTMANKDDIPADLAGGNCVTITGNVLIHCLPVTDAGGSGNNGLTDLEFLSRVTDIDGKLSIKDCDDLTSLNGLRSLRRITGTPAESLVITNSDQLTDIKALEGLQEVTQGSVSIFANKQMCYADLMDWGRVVRRARNSYDQDYITVVLFTAACLRFECAASCHCGYCGGPGGCGGQGGCENKWSDPPAWVESDGDKAAYAFLILFSLLFCAALLAFIVGYAMGEVRVQTLVTFQKPPRRVQHALRQQPFGPDGGPRYYGKQFDQDDAPVFQQPGTYGRGGLGRGDAEGEDEPRAPSASAASHFSLPALKQDIIPEEQPDGGGEQPAAEPPQRKSSIEQLLTNNTAVEKFQMPGQAELDGDGDGGGGGGGGDDDDDDGAVCPPVDEKKSVCICGADAEFECSRCGMQAYCSSECQRKDWKNHRDACKKAAREQKARRASVDGGNGPRQRRRSQQSGELKSAGRRAPPAGKPGSRPSSTRSNKSGKPPGGAAPPKPAGSSLPAIRGTERASAPPQEPAATADQPKPSLDRAPDQVDSLEAQAVSSPRSPTKPPAKIAVAEAAPEGVAAAPEKVAVAEAAPEKEGGDDAAADKEVPPVAAEAAV